MCRQCIRGKGGGGETVYLKKLLKFIRGWGGGVPGSLFEGGEGDRGGYKEFIRRDRGTEGVQIVYSRGRGGGGGGGGLILINIHLLN